MAIIGTLSGIFVITLGIDFSSALLTQPGTPYIPLALVYNTEAIMPKVLVTVNGPTTNFLVSLNSSYTY